MGAPHGRTRKEAINFMLVRQSAFMLFAVMPGRTATVQQSLLRCQVCATALQSQVPSRHCDLPCEMHPLL